MKRYFILILLFVLKISTNAQIADSLKREVKLQGAINFRDIGGYTAKDGRHVKWGKIYRSAALDKLTVNDLEKLQHLAIAEVIDFRGPYEVKIAPDKLPSTARRISLPAGSEHIGDSNYLKVMVKNDSGLVRFYSDLTPFKNRYQPMFQELLTLNSDSAFLYHCSAGKDRTGIATALILYALGVDKNTIIQDYTATNYYRRNENAKAVKGMMQLYRMDETTANNLMLAKEDYINATFTAIEQLYGSINTFLVKELGLTDANIETLKQKFLE